MPTQQPLVRTASGLRALGALARAGLRPPHPVLAVVDGSTRDWSTRRYHLQAICGGLGAPDRRITVVDHDTLKLLDVGAGKHRSCNCDVPDALHEWVQARRVASTALLALEVLQDVAARTNPEFSDKLADTVGVARVVHHTLSSRDVDDEGPDQVKPLTRKALAALHRAITDLEPVIGSAGDTDEAPTEVQQLRRYVVRMSAFAVGDVSVTCSIDSGRAAIGRYGVLGTRANKNGSFDVAIHAPAAAFDGYHQDVTDLGPAPTGPESAQAIFGLLDAYQRVLAAVVTRPQKLSTVEAAAIALTMVTDPA